MEGEMTSRRTFLQGGTLATAGFVAGHAAEGAQEHQHGHGGHGEPGDYPRDRPGCGGPVGSPTDRGRLVPGLIKAGEPPVRVIVPDLPERLPWKMVGGAKEFHLHCQVVKRDLLPNFTLDCWGFNGRMPGPTIEATVGDRARLVVHNELPESTGIHWHGLEMPVRFDGVPGLTQPPIRPGETYAYEFDLHQDGTFFYHSHDGMQDAMGMVGLFIVYPGETYEPRVDRDFCLISQEWAILPGATIPNTMSMEWNVLTFNGRAGPYITPLVCKLGERVRIRTLNFSVMDHHPFHLHGLTFWVTGTEGGRMPEAAWYPGNTVLIGVAQVREVEFIANNVGDWPFHCHMFHHTMNFMSTMVGPMGGHTIQGMRAGGSPTGGMGIATGGGALSDSFGPSLGRSMGGQTGSERTVGNMTVMPGMAGRPAGSGHGGHAGMGGAATGRRAPGFPAGMMDMPAEWTPEQLAQLNKPETRGMRRDWYTGVEGLMTVVRILPPDLFEAVMSGRGDVPPGASIPGAEPGPIEPHGGHRHESDSGRMPGHGPVPAPATPAQGGHQGHHG
jgi:FtsP/CotA-like multicopper oxidase with cupredoxin domain